MIKALQQWLCNHSMVIASHKATHVYNWDNKIRATCRLCSKVFYKTGKEVTERWTFDQKECACNMKKKN